MKTHSHAILLVLGLAALGACGDDDQPIVTETEGTITGTIADTDGAALAGATVTAAPGSASAVTGADGRYSLELEEGTYTVTATLDGYVAGERTGVAVTAGGSTTLDLVLGLATGTFSLQVNDGCGTGGLEGVGVTVDGEVVGTTDAGGTLELTDLTPGEYTLELAGPAGYLPDSATGTVAAGETATATVTLICQTKAVGDMARAFTAQLGTWSGVTSAQAVWDNMNDGDTTNDPTHLVSVRAPDAYAVGHVPGAINVPWKTIADDPIGTFGEPDGTHTIVDYCYTGHTGAIAAGILNLLGYHTSNMKFGIYSWTTDVDVLAGAGAPDLSKDFATESTLNEPTETYDLPWLAAEGVTTPFEAAQKAAQAYLSTAAATISAQDLFDNLNDGNTANDPFIISVRKPEHYAVGHIPGAINIPYAQIADEAQLRRIPADRDIVVYCYTGHTGGIATAILGTLGYQNVKNLKFGIHGWTQDADVRAIPPFNPATDVHDFPTEP